MLDFMAVYGVHAMTAEERAWVAKKTRDDVLVSANSAENGGGAAHARRPSIFADPTVRRLALVAAGLLVLYLATVVSALVMGVIGRPGPTTRIERDIAAYEAQVMESPEDVSLWARYVSALIESGQYMRAQDVIDRATAVVDQSSSQALLLAQAQLYYETGRYQEAVETADEVRDLLEAHYEQAKQTEGTPESLGAPISDNYYAALLVKAEALVALGKTEEAVKALDLYLESKPADAAALIRRASLKEKLGDVSGAEEDYRAALRFVPDDPLALEGLKRIGAE